MLSLRFDQRSLKIEPFGSPCELMRLENAMRKLTAHRLYNASKLGEFERLESRRLMVANWQNPGIPCDVDSSGIVAPVDALILSNRSRVGE